MKITWLGHSGFRIETAGQILLVDPWLRGNPAFDEARFDEAIAGATAILLTHGHFDHAGNAVEIARAAKAPICGVYDLVSWLTSGASDVEGVGFNKGGTIALGEARVTMVHATHSASASDGERPVCVGSETGFVIAGGGTTLYVAGDTDVHSDMALVQELHRPDLGILPIGGHFTMDAARAAFACRKFFSFRAAIPCHYRTFPLLAQSAEEFATLAAPTKVVAPEVMETVEL
ncbi:MAG: metal-dependent hydrolase [Rubrimonas sp.]|uniref:metal-dependent hydrolase n=1 Tax=Rubrimonas sp. TaxID=2036015 RepID=UPI002FDD4965